jgi:hypothetical protein
MKGILIVIAIIFVGLLVETLGIHYTTTLNGTHTGMISAVETNGIIFKTHTVYVKTDSTSSQEDAYCLIDESLIPQLKKLEQTKTKITVTYHNYLLKGWKYCNGEAAIITGVAE